MRSATRERYTSAVWDIVSTIPHDSFTFPGGLHWCRFKVPWFDAWQPRTLFALWVLPWIRKFSSQNYSRNAIVPHWRLAEPARQKFRVRLATGPNGPFGGANGHLHQMAIWKKIACLASKFHQRQNGHLGRRSAIWSIGDFPNPQADHLQMARQIFTLITTYSLPPPLFKLLLLLITLLFSCTSSHHRQWYCLSLFAAHIY